MKIKKTFLMHLLSAMLFLPFLLPSSANAASEDECAIWICLPGGFAPSECNPAKSAMISRVKDLKPPLPPFSACMNDPDAQTSNMTSNYGVAAVIPEHQECTSMVDHYNGMQCASYKTVPEQRIRGTSCTVHHESGIREPAGCTRTERYAEVFVDGVQQGPTHWY